MQAFFFLSSTTSCHFVLHSVLFEMLALARGLNPHHSVIVYSKRIMVPMKDILDCGRHWWRSYSLSSVCLQVRHWLGQSKWLSTRCQRCQSYTFRDCERFWHLSSNEWIQTGAPDTKVKGGILPMYAPSRKFVSVIISFFYSINFVYDVILFLN